MFAVYLCYTFKFRTALHWATKRSHGDIVSYLLEMGADKTVKNNDNQMPSDLSSDSVVRSLLGGEGSYETKEENDQLPFIPNYLLHLPLVLDWSNEHTVVKAECIIRHENKDGAIQ